MTAFGEDRRGTRPLVKFPDQSRKKVGGLVRGLALSEHPFTQRYIAMLSRYY